MTTPRPIQDADNLVWLDLEMTGLEVERQVILQAAVIITNSQLEPLAELAVDVWQPPTAFEHMSPFVQQMHEATGLLARVKTSTVDLAEAEQRLLRLVASYCPMGAVLCGNSIGQDRRFVDRYMPGLAAYLGYRMVDVSSLKVLAGRWYGDAAVYPKSKTGAHDALVDINNSIKELRHYRDTLFVAAPRS